MAIGGGRTLMVYLAADTANFKRNMDSAERSAKDFGSSADRVGSGLANVLGPALLAAGVAAAAMAAKFGVNHPSLRLLEEYKEEVRLGKREPLVGDSKVRWVSDS